MPTEKLFHFSKHFHSSILNSCNICMIVFSFVWKMILTNEKYFPLGLSISIKPNQKYINIAIFWTPRRQSPCMFINCPSISVNSVNCIADLKSSYSHLDLDATTTAWSCRPFTNKRNIFQKNVVVLVNS